MKILWNATDSRFELGDHTDADALIAKNCGFVFVSGSASWGTPDAEVVKTLHNNSLKLSTKLTISELAMGYYKAAGMRVLDAVEQSRAQDSDMYIPVPEGLELLPFQRAGVAYMTKRARVALFDEMGLGKTPQAICTINADRKAERILVVCPASLKLNWLREFKKWTTKFFDFQIVSGTELVEFTSDVTIINYDILQAHRAALREMKWDVIVLDESHYLRNSRTGRTREIFGGIKRNKEKEVIDRVEPLSFRKVLMLSGTPVVNKPKELWPMLQVLDPDGLGSDWFHYAKRYCQAFQIVIGGKAKGWKWDGASNLDELQNLMRSRFMVRRLKKDVLKDLPAKRRQIIVLEPKPALKKLVAKEAATYEKYFGDKVDTDIALSPSFDKISEIRKLVAIQKIPYVVEHIKEVLNEQEKIVFFGYHHETLDAVEEAFAGSCVRVDGRVSLQDRQAAVDKFQSDPGYKVFIGGIQAAGVGLTLTAASVVIFGELDWVPGNITQAEDRCHRIGQKEQVLVQHIVLADSLDERMVNVLVKKQEIIDKALDK